MVNELFDLERCVPCLFDGLQRWPKVIVVTEFHSKRSEQGSQQLEFQKGGVFLTTEINQLFQVVAVFLQLCGCALLLGDVFLDV